MKIKTLKSSFLLITLFYIFIFIFIFFFFKFLNDKFHNFHFKLIFILKYVIPQSF